MRTIHATARIAAGALLAGAVTLAGLGLAAGSAQAQPVPAPLDGAWPGCPNNHPAGPCHWCPGDPPVQTGNMVVNPVIWDAGICHTYWYVSPGQGNVSTMIWEGDTPPPPPPPPPAPPFVIDRSNCQQILGIFCPHA